MSGENKKKNFPTPGPSKGLMFVGGLCILLFLILQMYEREGDHRVGFSHQVEHLLNLSLLQKDSTTKTSQNDNLVSFSGSFKSHLTEDSRARFRFLELLDESHRFHTEKEALESRLQAQKDDVLKSANWFLAFSGVHIPPAGFTVVGSSYDVSQFDAAVVLHKISVAKGYSLRDLRLEYDTLVKNVSPEGLARWQGNARRLIADFRSSKLGIGDENLKQRLQELSERFDAVKPSGGLDLGECQQAVQTLEEIVYALQQTKDNVALVQLRSVRRYSENLKRLAVLSMSLAANEGQLDRARESVIGLAWYFNDIELSTKMLEKQDADTYHQWFSKAQEEWQNFQYNQGQSFRVPYQPRNKVLEKHFRSVEPPPNYLGYFITMAPIFLIVFLVYFFFSKQMKGVGANAMTFGKSPARLLSKDQNKITFDDVAGAEEAKEELCEIVDFLRDPEKFTALGAHIPKGVLCIGAPGTGKTLLAKAVAGEADRPFFFISGSDFVEMFVGVGASRIRDLFEQAKKSAPCIVFIDEIDAVGRHRGAGVGGGHDEREQTLNQLLVELDGINSNQGVILVAATNRPDVLDKALLRPGRFDRRIVIDLPDMKGRLEILKVHARKVKLDNSVNLLDIARTTPGASGADLANILNEAALLAARRGRKAVTPTELAIARDKVRYGKERRSLEVDKKEKETTAIHEAGHAIVGMKVEFGDPVDKVTIVPRGLSLGATHFMPKKNRVNYWKRELLDQLAVLMGGRVAEEIFVKDISSGAQMDISQATKLVRSMVCEWGMTEALGIVAYGEKPGSEGMGISGGEKGYSEESASKIDKEVRLLLEEAYQKAKSILEQFSGEVRLLSDMLVEFETLDRQDISDILDGVWDVEKKRKKIQEESEMHKGQMPPPPPPPPTDGVGDEGGSADFKDEPTTQGIS